VPPRRRLTGGAGQSASVRNCYASLPRRLRCPCPIRLRPDHPPADP
jgi:hypothetical protein